MCHPVLPAQISDTLQCECKALAKRNPRKRRSQGGGLCLLPQMVHWAVFTKRVIGVMVFIESARVSSSVNIP